MIEQLLGEMPLETFIDQYYLKLPFALPGRCDALCELGSWRTIESIVSGESEPDILIVAKGRRWEGTRVPPFDKLRQLHEEGYTVLVRHAERHHAGLAKLAADFAADFAGPVDIHIYCTPAQHHGFGWHYDAEDVFIVQTAGVKEYSLRKNTVNPWPLVETLPRDMRYEREIMPLMKCSLAASDWLYIPAGYWHMARAEQAAISLAIGVESPAAIKVLDWLRPKLLESLLWRQRLPVSGKATTRDEAALIAEYRRIFHELGEDLARELGDDRAPRAFLAASAQPIKGAEAEQKT